MTKRIDDYKRLINASRQKAKLSDHEVALIRELYEEGLGAEAIAKRCGVDMKAAVRKYARVPIAKLPIALAREQV